jgi:group I intron endonuclease
MNTINYKGNSTKTGIYLIRNTLNNKVYVGSTKRSFHCRKTRHLNALLRNTHGNEHLQNSVNKYGIENFVFEVYILCDPDDCERLEYNTILLFKSNNNKKGYNIASVRN